MNYFNPTPLHFSLCVCMAASYLDIPTLPSTYYSFLPAAVLSASCWHTRGLAAVLGCLSYLGVPLCIPQLHGGCLHFKTLLVETKEAELTDPSQRVQEDRDGDMDTGIQNRIK